MGDIKLFRVGADKIDELTGTTDTIEKSVQTFFEKNLEALLGVRFLASEFIMSSGRIDTLGARRKRLSGDSRSTSGPQTRTLSTRASSIST